MTEALEFLISRGHVFDDLWHRRTIDQVWLFYKAAHENSKREMLDSAIAARVAFGADKKDWQKFVQELSPKKLPQVLPREKFKLLRRLLGGK